MAASTPKKGPRRIGAEDSKTRAHLVDVTERLMLAEGYAAVTSRRVASEAGVTPPLVHYYFPTLDDLFIAVLHRRADQELERHARLLASDDPLRALWRFNTNRKGARLLTEFMALANHRKSIRGEIAASAEQFRAIEIEALEQAVTDGRLDLGGMSAAAVLVLLSTSSRGLMNEKEVGMSTGHDEVDALVDDLLGQTRRSTLPVD